jgi:hypothetical protein
MRGGDGVFAPMNRWKGVVAIKIPMWVWSYSWRLLLRLWSIPSYPDWISSIICIVHSELNSAYDVASFRTNQSSCTNWKVVWFITIFPWLIQVHFCVISQIIILNIICYNKIICRYMLRTSNPVGMHEVLV